MGASGKSSQRARHKSPTKKGAGHTCGPWTRPGISLPSTKSGRNPPCWPATLSPSLSKASPTISNRISMAFSHPIGWFSQLQAFSTIPRRCDWHCSCLFGFWPAASFSLRGGFVQTKGLAKAFGGFAGQLFT